jgi:FAD-dependent oxidoreductase family protein
MNRRTFLQTSSLLVSASAVFARSAELKCDVAVIGAGTGGYAAAVAALRNGMRVILTEETDWIGGQLTAQGVPPDEHPWIEDFGCTLSYREFRDGVREYYRQHLPLTAEARSRRNLNPGNGTVSRLTHDPRVGLAVLESGLASYVVSGQLVLLLRHVPVKAEVTGDRVSSVTVHDINGDRDKVITAPYFVDATETGELLPLTRTEFVTGAESQRSTDEPHAPQQAQPRNVQSFTFCFAVDYLAGENHIIDRPSDYAFWRDYVPKLTPPWTGKLLSWTCPHPQTLRPRETVFDPRASAVRDHNLNLWIYRRIADPANFVPGTLRSGITLVNWPQNDYWLGDILSASALDRGKFLAQAKQLSLSWLYWMQADAPRVDGGTGWKGLRLRHDVLGTEDGLAKYPYIRESRRIEAEFTVLEQHVGTEARMKATGRSRDEVAAATFNDSVGIGCYRLDLHPATGGDNYIDISSLPFQIPMGSLIPKRVENLLAGCKNLGVTHITNGCYRLHPVEWNIGEAAGAIAAQAIKTGTSPTGIRKDPKKLNDLQASLREQGFELEWPRIHPV